MVLERITFYFLIFIFTWHWFRIEIFHCRHETDTPKLQYGFVYLSFFNFSTGIFTRWPKKDTNLVLVWTMWQLVPRFVDLTAVGNSQMTPPRKKNMWCETTSWGCVTCGCLCDFFFFFKYTLSSISSWHDDMSPHESGGNNVKSPLAHPGAVAVIPLTNHLLRTFWGQKLLQAFVRYFFFLYI